MKRTHFKLCVHWSLIPCSMQQNFANFVLLHFARQCSYTSKVWWAIWHGFCCKFIGEYNSEIILKIGKHLSKLWTNVCSGTVFVLTVYTMWGKKTAPYYFCNSFVRVSSITTVFGTRILQWISYHLYIPYYLYSQRRGTSLSMKSTVGQSTVHTQPSCRFLARRRTSIVAPNLWLPNFPEFST